MNVLSICIDKLLSIFLIYLDIECAIARPKVFCYFCVSIKIMQFASAPFILCVVQLQLLYLPLPAPTETEGKLWCIHTFRKILQNCVKKLDYPNTIARLQLRKTPIKPNIQPLRVWTMTKFLRKLQRMAYSHVLNRKISISNLSHEWRRRARTPQPSWLRAGWLLTVLVWWKLVGTIHPVHTCHHHWSIIIYIKTMFQNNSQSEILPSTRISHYLESWCPTENNLLEEDAILYVCTYQTGFPLIPSPPVHRVAQAF